MKKTGFIIAALAAAALAGTSAYADDLTFRTEEGTVVYAEEEGTSVGISKEDLIRYGKAERNEDRAFEVKGKAKMDIGFEVGDDESGMSMKIKADVDALMQKDASANEYSLLDMKASMFGQDVRNVMESSLQRDADGNVKSYMRESDSEGNMGEWQPGGAETSAEDVEATFEKLTEDFDLLENMYTDEQGFGYYVLQADKTFADLSKMLGDINDGAEDATESFEFDRPVRITLMYRVEDCAFARGYADVSGLTGMMSGEMLGSETPVKMTVDGIVNVSVDDMEGDAIVPSDLPDGETPAPVQTVESDLSMTVEGTEFAIPSSARAIEASGWTVEEEYSGDERVAPQGLTYVKFVKDGMDLTAFVYNSGNEEADALDCDVYELSFMKGYGNASNDVQVLDGLVEIGMSEADLATALDAAGIAYEKEDQGDGYCYYEIAADGEDAGYEFGLNEDDGVWQIEVRDESVWN